MSDAMKEAAEEALRQMDVALKVVAELQAERDRYKAALESIAQGHAPYCSIKPCGCANGKAVKALNPDSEKKA